MDTLDITDWKQTHNELRAEIAKAVAATQAIIIQPLPSKVLMSKEQFMMLEHDPQMQQLWQSQDRLYVTPLNVMEVQIKQ